MKKIEFIVTFHTDDNATIQVKYRFRTTKGEEFENRLQLDEVSSDTWRGFLTFDNNVTELTYGYEVTRNNTTIRSEWGDTPHKINIEATEAAWQLYDKWYDAPFCNYMQSGLFKKFYHRNTPADNNKEITIPEKNTDILLFDIQACGLAADETLVLTGDSEEFGSWTPQRGVRMTNVSFNRWQCAIEASTLLNNMLNFKFVALNTTNGEARWEAGDNRTFFIADKERPTIHRITFEGIDFGSPRLRVAGTVIPLFSLRSESSWGIGDFGDLKKMAEWLAATGQHVLQLLPVNDTTIYGGEGDSYPYNCVSVFALHQQYVDISALPAIKDGRTRAAFFRRAKRLNESRTFDYPAVNELKENYLRKLYKESGEKLLTTPEFKLFEKEQQAWLKPYCAYRFLSKFIHPGPGNWGVYSSYEDDTYERLIKEFDNAAHEMNYHALVQYFLYKQLKEAHEYSLSLGVAIKGDIPIGVSPDGVDVWCDRKLFNCKGSAGAPPDAFSADGQNWGFPTYNWETMALDGYSWWKRRLKYMSNFFDAYRIDHILGFFRIWEIPSYVSSGLSGHFRPSKPLTVEEIEKAGFYFDASQHSCSKSTEMPADKPADLLFIPDETLPGYYHPRIMASETNCYLTLGERNKQAFDRIYEDFFYHRHTNFWFEEAMKKLAPLLSATSMTACGEDLGMIPACVPWAMSNLQILSLEIQRMPKQYGVRFARTEEYPYLSVATPSTHDMSTLREWWTENPDDTQHFYNEVVGHEGKAPEEMDGSIAKAILNMHLKSPSMLAMIAWQDWMAMDERLRYPDACEERINIPANRGHVWNYRMHMTIEELSKQRAFNETVSQMIQEADRIPNV